MNGRYGHLRLLVILVKFSGKKSSSDVMPSILFGSCGTASDRAFDIIVCSSSLAVEFACTGMSSPPFTPHEFSATKTRGQAIKLIDTPIF